MMKIDKSYILILLLILLCLSNWLVIIKDNRLEERIIALEDQVKKLEK